MVELMKDTYTFPYVTNFPNAHSIVYVRHTHTEWQSQFLACGTNGEEKYYPAT